VVGVNGARASSRPERFSSLRDEIYFALRDRFEARRIIIPDDDLLKSQLASLRYGFNSRGQQKVESKEEMRSRGMPSPDRADALALCFAPLPEPNRPRFLVGPGRPVIGRMGWWRGDW
jgi:phage terminase large subunit